jgi:DNA-binding NarL/FixJ family response regulator
MHDNESYIARAFQHGALAYVLKDSSVDDLVKAVRSTLLGRKFMSPAVHESLSESWDFSDPASIEDRYESLTHREREILQLVAEGLTSSEIADRLFISSRTADTHRTNLMVKLDLRSQTDLVHFAIQRGLIHPKPRRREP